MIARLRAVRRDVELFTLIGLSCLLAAVGALLGAVAGDDDPPPTKPSPRR